jgi:hypothetical protein
LSAALALAPMLAPQTATTAASRLLAILEERIMKKLLGLEK